MDALCASTPEHFFSIMKRVKKMCSLGADIVRHDLCAGQGVSPKGIEKDIVVDGMDVVAFFFLVLSPHLEGALCLRKFIHIRAFTKKMHSYTCIHMQAVQIAAITYELCRLLHSHTSCADLSCIPIEKTQGMTQIFRWYRTSTIASCPINSGGIPWHLLSTLVIASR